MQRISKSVGKGGKNDEADAKIVQELLNKFTKIGGYGKLDVDGKVGKGTINAISAFQEKAMGIARPDGLVEPGKNTFKKLNENASAVAKEAKANESGGRGGGAGKGKVSGDTQGVKSYILDFLQEIASHYSTAIVVNSGLRDANKQADAMWKYWKKTLRRGEKYIALASDRKLLKQLDDWWHTGNEDQNADPNAKAAAEKDFKSTIVKMADKLSYHLAGRAVDLALNTDKRVIKVLEMHLYTFDEKDESGKTSGLHFDDSHGKKVPVVTDALKRKWPPK